MIADATAKDFHAYSKLTILMAVVHTGFFWVDKKEKIERNISRVFPLSSLGHSAWA